LIDSSPTNASSGEAAGSVLKEIVLARPDDFHVHFRQGDQLALYVKRHSASFGRAIVMPNTLPPVADAASLIAYREKIAGCLPGGSGFAPLMTFKILPGMSAKTVEACAAAGAMAGKYYPAGATTNAADGPSNLDAAAEALSAMESAGIVLSIHGEDPDAPSLERETAFLPTLEKILARWPRLRVVLEHLSTKEAADFVAAGPERLAATITAHHLLFTIDDMLGGSLNAHLFCKPIIKSAADREALRNAAFSASPKFFFGSDSAPHARAAKESAHAPGGIYSSPVAIPALVGLFESAGALEALGPFVAGNGARFYRLPAPTGTIRLRREAWKVPDEIDGVVPMCAGAELAWRLA
jgi:dihydroorotase